MQITLFLCGVLSLAVPVTFITILVMEYRQNFKSQIKNNKTKTNNLKKYLTSIKEIQMIFIALVMTITMGMLSYIFFISAIRF